MVDGIRRLETIMVTPSGFNLDGPRLDGPRLDSSRVFTRGSGLYLNTFAVVGVFTNHFHE